MLSSERAFDDFLTGLNPFVAQLRWERFERDGWQVARDAYDAETEELVQQLRAEDPARIERFTAQETAEAIRTQRNEEYRFRAMRSRERQMEPNQKELTK